MKSLVTAREMVGMAVCGTVPEWATNPLRYISLHSSDPGDSSDQTVSEMAFEGYTRIRSLCSQWVMDPRGVTNRDELNGPVCWEEDCEGLVITHVAIGLAPEGPGQILYSGRLSSPIELLPNSRPTFEPGALTFIET